MRVDIGSTGDFSESYVSITTKRSNGAINLSRHFEREHEGIAEYQISLIKDNGDVLSFGINRETLNLLVHGLGKIRNIELDPSNETENNS